MRSETAFLFKLLLLILLTPITLILLLFKKKRSKDILQPFIEIYTFILEAKCTYYIILANVLMYILSFFFSEALFVSLINYPSDILHFKFHTLLTAGFLHANLAHLVGNMLGIFVFGRVVEKHIGAQKTAFVYMGALIISGVFNALIHLFVFNDNTGGIGASGALMGLVATAMLLNPLYISYAFLFPLPIMVMGWFTLYLDIMGILTPNSSNIGHFAHVGGFLSITILMFFIQKKQQLKKGLYINIASALLIVLLYVFVVK